jgi:hypothetical protein
MRIPVKMFPAFHLTDGLCVECPGCSGANLHHFEVTTYDRKEDAAETVETKIHCGSDSSATESGGGNATRLTVPSANCRNPSERRGAIVITFWCENCAARPELILSQHKGSTCAYWRPLGETYIELH